MKSSTVPWICPGFPGIIQDIYHSCLDGMKLPISYSVFLEFHFGSFKDPHFLCRKEGRIEEARFEGKGWVSAY